MCCHVVGLARYVYVHNREELLKNSERKSCLNNSSRWSFMMAKLFNHINLEISVSLAKSDQFKESCILGHARLRFHTDCSSAISCTSSARFPYAKLERLVKPL